MINDRKLLYLIDKENKNQSEAARELGVSRQAVSKRLMELRGRQTRVMVAKKIEEAVDLNLDAMAQLMTINKKTLALLDEAELNPKLALSCIAEVRSQIKLAADIYSQMYSVKVVNEFMAIVSEVLKNVDADVYQEFKERVNRERSLRQAVRFS
jgi:DNA-binding XRE family transcriptional regulator